MKKGILVLILGILTTLPTAFASPSSERALRDEKPDEYVLSAAYPNPFNPTTTFSLSVKERQEVTIEVFNLLGVRVAQIFQGVVDVNEARTFTFDAGDLPSGIYLYRVQGRTFTATRQATLLK